MRKSWTDGLVNVTGDVDGDFVKDLKVVFTGEEGKELKKLSDLQIHYFSDSLKKEGKVLDKIS